jgi:hypothetical protein
MGPLIIDFVINSSPEFTLVFRFINKSEFSRYFLGKKINLCKINQINYKKKN